MQKRKAFSMSEVLITMGLIGVLAITVLSLNNYSDINYEIAETKFAKVDNAIKSWGKAVTKVNETGLGAVASVGDDLKLQNSLKKHFTTIGEESTSEGISTNIGSLEGATTLTLNDDTNIEFKSVVGRTNNALAAAGFDKNLTYDSPVAVIVANVQIKGTDETIREEYVLFSDKLINLASIYEGYTKLELQKIADEDIYCIDEKICGKDICKDDKCGCAITPQPASCIKSDTQLFIGETTTENCGENMTGTIIKTEAATIEGVQEKEINSCCPSPKIFNGYDEKENNICICVKENVNFKEGYGFLATEDSCQTPCLAGTYAKDGVCEVCPAGSYCPNEKMTEPIPCPAGFECPNDGMTEPSKCPKGTYQNTKGQLNCNPCLKGSYCPDEAMINYILCDVGSYCSEDGMTEAKQCPENSYCPNDLTKKINKDYHQGKYIIDDKKEVTNVKNGGLINSKICPNNTYSEAGSTSCQTCSAGSYLKITYKKDKNGKETKEELSRECVLCDEGYYQDEAGAKGKTNQDGCKICPENNACPDKGMTEPNPCGENGYSVNATGDKVTSGGVACAYCPENTYYSNGVCRTNLCKETQNAIAIYEPKLLASIGIAEGYPLNEKYCQINDLSLAGYKNWTPIGPKKQQAFTGTYDGNNNKISNLKIAINTSEAIGLFNYTDNAVIRNTNIINANVTNKNNWAGSLIGYATNSKIENCSSSGTVYGYGAGGLIAVNNFTIIKKSHSSANVSGQRYVGGLVGSQVGEMHNCYATGNVSGDFTVGGLVGNNGGSNEQDELKKGILKYSYATGTVTGRDTVGGLAGDNFGFIDNSYASGNVSGDTNVGGLVGDVSHNVIKNSYASGNVSGNAQVGGLTGYNYYNTSITNCYTTTGKITGQSHVGATTGLNRGNITRTYYDNKKSNIKVACGKNDVTCNSVGKATVEMRQIPTNDIYVGWSKANWCFSCAKYPVLKNMPKGAPAATSCTTNICKICPEGTKWVKDTTWEDGGYCKSNSKVYIVTSYKHVANVYFKVPEYLSLEENILIFAGQVDYGVSLHKYGLYSGSWWHDFDKSNNAELITLLSKMSPDLKAEKINTGKAFIIKEDGNLLTTAANYQIAYVNYSGNYAGWGNASSSLVNNSFKVVKSLGMTNANRNDKDKEEVSGGQIQYKNIVYDVAWTLYRKNTPLVLDLKGDGLKFTNIENGVNFDLDGDGTINRTSWTTVQSDFDNAFLCIDKNSNGIIDNGKELFGDQNGANTGFEELAKYDDNNDGKITKEDKSFEKLLLWCDMNKNGQTDEGELRTLLEMKITELSTSFEEKRDENGNLLEDEYGNTIGLVGQFKMLVEEIVDGILQLVEKVRLMIDVLFNMI